MLGKNNRIAICLALIFAVSAAAVDMTGVHAGSQAATAVKTVEDSGPTVETLRAAMDKYGKTYSSASTVTDMQDVLGRMLLSDIELLLKKHINTSEFQEAFLALQDEYKYLDRNDIGVVNYAKTILEKNTNSDINMYNKLVTLYSYAHKALRKIYEAAKIPRSSSYIDTFMNTMVDNDGSVRKVVQSYSDQFETMAGYDMLQTCLLGGDTRNKEIFRYYLLSDFARSGPGSGEAGGGYLTRFKFTVSDDSSEILPAMGLTSTDPTYKGLYDQMLNVYKIEKSYSNLHYTKDSTTPISEKFADFEYEPLGSDGLSDGLYIVYTKFCRPVSEGGLGSKGEADAFIRAQYNGTDILELIQQYLDLKDFLSSLATTPDEPKSSEEIARAIETNNKYQKLTASEKAKLSTSEVDKLNRCIPAKNSIENVVNLIKAITYPTTETEYRNTFVPALQRAETAYNSLLQQYPGMGIESFVDNRSLLTGEYKVYKNYMDQIFAALSIEDSSVCSKLATVITPLRTELQALNKTYPNVYNHLIGYSTFETLYNDATTAKKLRDRVDALRISPSSADAAELTSIKTAVSMLNAKAKAYFGTLYEQYIQAIEYGSYTDDVNMANRVDTLISRIGTVNANSGPKIEAARSAYDSLTDLQKSLVKNYNILVAAEQTFKQLSQDISYATVTNIKTGYVYTHSEIQPEPIVKINGLQLTKGVHYTVEYANNLNVGTGSVTIRTVAGSGYTGLYTKTFLIVQDSVDTCAVSGLKKKYKYTGKKIKPSITVKVNGFKLKKGTDYKLTYSNNKKVGTASIKIKGIKNYKGSRTVTFKIYKKKKKKK